MRSTRVSMLARVGSATAIAGLAIAGALAPVTAASAATTHRLHKIPTHLFVRDHAVPGTHHKTDAIIGLLRTRGHGLPGKTVELFSRTKGTKWAEVSSATTARHGLVKFTVTPATRTAYVLVFAGDVRYRHSHSAVILLRAPKA
jgi:hypothetical protein